MVFTLLNSFSIWLNYYIGHVKVYVPLLLVIELALGVTIGWLLFCPSYLKLKSSQMKLKSRNKQLQKEVDNLRILPIKD